MGHVPIDQTVEVLELWDSLNEANLLKILAFHMAASQSNPMLAVAHATFRILAALKTCCLAVGTITR